MAVVSILPLYNVSKSEKFLNDSGRIKQLKEYSMPITPHAIWNFVEQSDFCWVMLFYTTENKTMTEFNQHERLKITFRKLQPAENMESLLTMNHSL